VRKAPASAWAFCFYKFILYFQSGFTPRGRDTWLRGREAHGRLIVKAASWGLTGSMGAFAISWIVTGRSGVAGAFAATELLTKVLYHFSRPDLGRGAIGQSPIVNLKHRPTRDLRRSVTGLQSSRLWCACVM
jgi:Predicted membrane protein (DUF2061)